MTRWLNAPHHILYHRLVVAPITETGRLPPDWEDSGLCCLLPSEKDGEELLNSGCCPAPTKPHQSRWASFLPSVTSVHPPGPRSQSCSLTWSTSPTSISGYPFPSSLERIRLPVPCLPTTPSVRGCLLSFPEGSESPGGLTPGVKGASGNYQCPSLSCSLSSCLSSLSLGNVNIQQPCLAGKRWKKM